MPVEPSIDPFPGLRRFEANEGHLFFGREGQSEEILRLLRRQRFLAVVGSSGSGKSSLVRAGLLPYLYGGFLAQAGSHWRVAIFTPGSSPIRNLADALNDPTILGKPAEDPAAAAQSIMLLEVSLRRSGLGLIEVVRLARLPEQERVLVVVDQFEELFRFAGAVDKPGQEEEAAAFVKLLLYAGGQREVPVYIVLTMRSDFIGDCARYHGLPEAVTAGLYLIPRMTREQRRLAIVEPVRVGGGSMAPRLVNRLLNDVGDDPDQLPILQHALMRTWDYWKTHDGDHRPIELDDYLAIGGMAAALSQHADESYDRLQNDRDRATARRIFQALSEKGPDYRETRRPTSVETLAQVAGVPNSDIIHVLEEFRRPGRSFLMPPVGVALEANSVIDISHESLIRGWQRLRQWVDEEMESARVYCRLAETAGLHAKGTAGLWHDPDLQNALAWREKERPTAAWGNRYRPGFEQAMAFLELSRAVHETERRKQESSRRRALGSAIAALAVVTALAIFSLIEWREAVQQQQAAQHQRDRAEHAVTTFITRLFSVSGIGAIEDLDREIKLDPTDATIYFLRALLYSTREDYDRAIADLSRMIELDPTFAAGYLSRGGMYEKKKDYDRAIADFDQALKLDTKNAIIYSARGWVYHLKLDYDRAIADYDEAIKLNPNFAMAYNGRGLDYENKTDHDRAIADYDQAIKLKANYSIAYSNRGLSYHNKGNYDRAIADYDEAIRLDPKNSLSYSNAAYPITTRGTMTARSPITTKRLGSIPRIRSRTATAAGPITAKGTMTAPSPITTRRLGSIPRIRSRTTTAAGPITAKGTMTAPSPITTRRLGSIPRIRSRTTTAALSITPRRTTIARSPTTARRSGSTPIMHMPTTTVVSLTAPWGTMIALSRTSTKRSKSIQIIAAATTTAAMSVVPGAKSIKPLPTTPRESSSTPMRPVHTAPFAGRT
jgi:tetratricopeptide (TPR) repeat protein